MPQPRSDDVRPHIIGLAWFWHRRTEELCRYLGIELIVLRSARHGFRRYLALTFRTLEVVRRRRPKAILVQSPSVVSVLWLYLLRFPFRFKLVMDAHNEAVVPYLHRSRFMLAIVRFLLRRADATIVTNAALASVVGAAGGKPLILPDKIPGPPAFEHTTFDRFTVAIVSTFEDDEPIQNVFAAAAMLPDIQFVVTGSIDKFNSRFDLELPANVRLAGFLPDAEYWGLLASANVVMDLTTMDDCLVCGAYEALAVETPVILSDNTASRGWFSGFGEFANPYDPADIVRAVRDLCAAAPALTAGFAERRKGLEERWAVSALSVDEVLSRLACGRGVSG